MNTSRSLQFFLAAVSLMILSCQPATNIADVRKEIAEADARQLAAFQSKDVAAMITNYAEDAVVMPQNEPMARGRENITASFQRMSEAMGDFHFSMTSLDASGDLAYEIGNYSGTWGGMADEGKYLTVWKKQADGKWLIVADMFNTNLAPPAMMDQTGEE